MCFDTNGEDLLGSEIEILRAESSCENTILCGNIAA